MKRFTYALGAMIALGVAPLAAQQTGVVRGRVTDNTSQQPIAGVTISIGSRITTTSSAGRYFITGVPVGRDSVRARIIGYAPMSAMVSVVANDSVTADFALTPQAIQLSELVAVGYGNMAAGNITGAVQSVSDSQFNVGQIATPTQLIENKIAGVQIVDNNDPGGGIAIRIRGATSVTASSDPLYVIDGMPVGNGSGGGLSAGRDALNFLNPDDIQSITVLKDASAAAIYGTNAANGVVLITTKNGGGRPRVEYSTSFSASSVTRLPQMLSAGEFRAAVTQYDTANLHQLGSANTDWFGLVDRTGWGTDHNLTVSGGGTNAYRLSLGYFNQDGVIKGSSTQRISLGVNSNLHFFSDRLSVQTNIRGARTYDRFTPGGVLSNAAQMGPTQPVFDSTAATGYYNNPGGLQSPDNPLEILNLSTNYGTTYRSVGNVQGEYVMPFLQALKAHVNLGYDVTKVTNESFGPNTLHREIVGGQHGYDFRSDNSMINGVFEAYLNYAAPLRIARGDIDLTGGYSYSSSNAQYPSTLYQGLSSNLLGTNGVVQATTITPLLDIENSRLVSFFGRANYNLNDKYLAAVTLRRDKSSRFGNAAVGNAGNAWGTFPSVAVAWRISQENFMSRFTNLSDLKLRATWAKTGNQSFANYQQYFTYSYGNSAAQVQWGNGFVGTLRPNAGNPLIQWEGTSSYNLGLDYGFSNQRINGSLDWYNKKTTGLIFTTPAPAGSNFSNFVTVNVGDMKNTGVEFSINYDLLRSQNRGHGLTWTTNFNVSHNTNELTRITAGGGQFVQTGGIAGGVGTTIQVLQPGQPINSFYVCRQAYGANGKPLQGMYHATVYDTVNNVAQAPKDSVINGCGGTNIAAEHDPAPKWIFGHTSYLTYGHLDFSFTLRAWLGNYVYNNVESNLGTYSEVTRGSPFNLSRDVLNTGFTQPQYLSDYYVRNGSFLRMDNITIGWGFSYQGRPMRVYGSVQNVFTITGYDGVDPTAGINGIDNNIYPRSRTVTMGLTLKL